MPKTPAMAIGLTNHLRTLEELAGLLEAAERAQKKSASN
jgi:hypothetical protein